MIALARKLRRAMRKATRPARLWMISRSLRLSQERIEDLREMRTYLCTLESAESARSIKLAEHRNHIERLDACSAS